MEFLGDISFLLALIVTAAGLGLVYFSKKEKSCWLSTSAWVLVVGGFLTGACIFSYMVHYRNQGDFDRASFFPMMSGKGMMDECGMMGGSENKKESSKDDDQGAAVDHASHH